VFSPPYTGLENQKPLKIKIEVKRQMAKRKAKKAKKK
jgi:hypothetical protein